MWSNNRYITDERTMAECLEDDLKRPFSIVKVESPDSYIGIWSPVFKPQTEQKTFYEFQEELNDYFCNVDVVRSLPKIGQLVVIRHPKDRRWRRAMVETILERSAGYEVVAFLVDTAETVSVSTEWVCSVTKAISYFPYQACRLHLPGLYPRSMQCDPETVTMHYSRSSKWDTAAFRYVNNLIRDHHKAEVSMIHSKNDLDVVGDLYLHFGDNFICVNSDLIAKGYAVASQAKFLDDTGECSSMGLDDVSSFTALCTKTQPSIPSEPTYSEIIRLQSELDKKFGCLMDDENDDDCSASDIMPPLGSVRQEETLNECSGGSSEEPIPPPVASLQTLLKQHSSIAAVGSSRASLTSSSSSCYSTSSGLNSTTSDERVSSTSIGRGRGRAILESLNKSKVKSGPSSVQSSKSPSPRASIDKRHHSRSPGYGRGTRNLDAPVQRQMGTHFQREPGKHDDVFSSKSDDSKNSSLNIMSLPTRPTSTNQVVSVGRNGDVPLARNTLSKEETVVDVRSCHLPNPKESVNAPTRTDDPSCSRLSDFEQKMVRSHDEGPAARSSTAFRPTVQLPVEKNELPRTGVCSNTGRPTASFGRGKNRSLTNDKRVVAPKNGFAKIKTDDVVFSSRHHVTPPLMPYFSTSMDNPLDIVANSKVQNPLVCGPMPPTPLMELKDAKFDDGIYKRLAEMHIVYPNTIQSYVWPALTRGRNVVAISGPGSGKTITYLTYLLDRIKDKNLYLDLPKNNQPVALVLCATWQKANAVYKDACFIANGSENAKVFLIHGGGYDESRAEYLIGGCDLLVATPCSLLRLLNVDRYKPTGFSRLCYFVVDDADILTDEFKEQIKQLMKLYMEQRKRPNQATSIAQFMAFGTKWTDMLKDYVKRAMVSPLLICGSFCEGAVYAGIKTYAHVYRHEEKLQKFVDEIILPHHEINNLKTVICTLHRRDANDIYSVLERRFPFSLIAHHGMGNADLQGVSRKWHGEHQAGKMPLLITTDACLDDLNIEDAECLIHYDIPELTKSQFGRRFCCIYKHMRRRDVVPSENDAAKLTASSCLTRLIITEKCYIQVHSLILLLNRLHCRIPVHLIALASGYHQRKETEKIPIPLCYFVKAFGTCPDLGSCSDRHILLKTVDAPSEHLLRGVEVVLHVTCVRDASQMYGRLVRYKEKDGTWKVQSAAYLSVALGMASHFDNPSNRVACESPNLGELFVVCVDSIYHRVRVTYKNHVREEDNVKEFQVFFVDDGRLDYFEASRILLLPDMFSSVPPQAFEIFLCNIRPIDKDESWTVRSCRAVEKLAVGNELTGKIAFSLGNTLWVNSLAKTTKILNSKEVMILYDIRKELLTSQYAMENPDHLHILEVFAAKEFVLPPPIEYDTVSVVIKRVETKDTSVSEAATCSFLPFGELVEVYVSCVVDPRRLYLLRVEFASCLDELMDDIGKHVKSGKVKGLKEIKNGMLCLAPLATDNNNYYRAQIITFDRKGDGFSPDDDVFLFYVDYGDTGHVKAGVLLPLDNRFLWKLPFQAIECGLANICPFDGTSEWSEESSNFLYDMTLDPNGSRQLMTVKVLKKSQSFRTIGNFNEVVLSTSNTYVVADNLIYLDLAKDVPESEMITEDTTGTQNTIEIVENVEELLTNGVNEVNGHSNDKPNDDNDFGVVPYVQWTEKADNIVLTIKIANVKEENQCLKIEASKFSFSATANNIKYQLDLDLFSEVNADDYRITIMETYVRIIMKKSQCKKWPRLIEKKEKLFFISADFEHYVDSSDEDEAVDSFPQCTELPSRSMNTVTDFTCIADYPLDNDPGSESDDSMPSLDFIPTNDGYDDFL